MIVTPQFAWASLFSRGLAVCRRFSVAIRGKVANNVEFRRVWPAAIAAPAQTASYLHTRAAELGTAPVQQVLATAAGRQTAANLAPLSAVEFHHSSAAHHGRQIKRVPVGKTDASMRFGLPNILRCRGAMYAVGRRR
jgi:hypothetical protein